MNTTTALLSVAACLMLCISNQKIAAVPLNPTSGSIIQVTRRAPQLIPIPGNLQQLPLLGGAKSVPQLPNPTLLPGVIPSPVGNDNSLPETMPPAQVPTPVSFPSGSSVAPKSDDDFGRDNSGRGSLGSSNSGSGSSGHRGSGHDDSDRWSSHSDDNSRSGPRRLSRVSDWRKPAYGDTGFGKLTTPWSAHDDSQ
ncbi:hypothetical protein THASP1DRAFT_28461 [Thamnocephalis sphaerospora]|uniref:Uncharacterized protein n=1 Tax=Thamnocephalis sphaerospora TaxID=78915 RepID=A0A4V1IX42_9FUNG|nr:hypothetical protein THASP1DRAFT_28461 [Thamnocephalis sphaerospora]|eukprot:RKP09749.1 hypothetical protein THASP1DRAFT_28461 [Thamnocephalis sphaerospora]